METFVNLNPKKQTVSNKHIIKDIKMANNATLTTNDKQTFAVKNPNTGKIIFFLNASQFVDADVINGLSVGDVESILEKCTVEKFVKSDKSDALDGLL